MKKRILVIGSLNMDLVVNVPSMPKVGETILGCSFKTVPGGKGANQAYAASKLGGDVYMIGNIGSDEYGEVLVNSLKSAGVNTDMIEKKSDFNTGLAFICINKDGDNSIVVVPGANQKCDHDILDRYKEFIVECDIVIVQLEIPIETVAHAVEIAKEMGKTVILNPAPAPDFLPDDILKNVDIITPNESELQKLTNIRITSLEDIDEAAHTLLAKGVRTVIVTWGDKGAVLVDNNKCHIFPAEPVDAVDTTAAGDTFTSAVAVALSEGQNLTEAIKFANKASAIVVTREGAQTSIPSREEVDNKNQ